MAVQRRGAVMFGILDIPKMGAAGLMGAALVWGWMNLVTIPAAEKASFDAGVAQCRADVDKEHAVELARQQDANDEALAAARERETELAEQADTLNEQLLDLANAITSDPGAADACLGPQRVRDLNAIR